MQREMVMKITYRWWNDHKIKPNHIDALDESANERIFKMIKMFMFFIRHFWCNLGHVKTTVNKQRGWTKFYCQKHDCGVVFGCL